MRSLLASLLFLAGLVGVAAPLRALPLDLSNPTPRTVLVEVDEFTGDYGAIGAAFGTPVEAAFTSDGVTALITVPGSVVEALVDRIFASPTAVPGSFSDYEIAIDVATGQVLSATVNGLATVPIFGTVNLAQNASSTTLAGFKLTNILGYILPLACTGGTGCTIVPGLPYDPATGQLNAVGVIATIFNVFTPFGDLRLSEAQAPLACEVAMSQPAYSDGQPVVITSLRFTNRTPNPIQTRLRLQLTLPFGITANAIDLGASGGFFIPGNFDRQLGPVTMFTLQPGQPRGAFQWRCALEDPTTGAIQAEDLAPFTFQ